MVCGFLVPSSDLGESSGGGDFPCISTQGPKTGLQGRKIAFVAKLEVPCKQKPELILH